MKPEESRKNYRADCAFRRIGHVIEEFVSGKWQNYKTYDSVNQAKATVRNHLLGGKSYTVR